MRSVVLVSLLLPSALAFGAPVVAPGAPIAAAKSPVAAPDVPSRALCNGGRFRCYARAQVDKAGRLRADDTPQGLGATDLESAYHLDPTLDPQATIALIDAYGDPTLEADLAAYRQTYGLPPCTVASGCLQIVNQEGQTSPLPAAPPMNDDWTVETALDVEMASAACPKCKLIVVQVDDDKGDGLVVGNDTAATLGATVISNSWGGPEPSASDLVNEETHFTHAGIAIFASSGDNGYEGSRFASFPATSSHVIAVGGTSLMKDPGTPRGWTESAWNGAGSGCSQTVSKPSWQPSTGCSFRAISDVSADGDPGTGPAVYSGGQWGVVGGTSAASPFVAGALALTGHGNATPQLPYQHPEMFNDVLTGQNGTCGTVVCNAGTGWDGPTGLGTPNGPLLAGAKLPSLKVTPGDKAIVPSGFSLTATCTSNDSATVSQVQVTFDGEAFPPITAAPFVFTAPTSFANGMHKLSVTCTTSSTATTEVDLTVTQVDRCTTDKDCASGGVCFDSACLTGPDTAGGFGATCSTSAQCMAGICAQGDSSAMCTIACDAAGKCPSGYTCTNDSGTSICWPGGGGGCDASADRTPPVAGALGLLLLFALGLVPRRRAAAR